MAPFVVPVTVRVVAVTVAACATQVGTIARRVTGTTPSITAAGAHRRTGGADGDGAARNRETDLLLCAPQQQAWREEAQDYKCPM